MKMDEDIDLFTKFYNDHNIFSSENPSENECKMENFNNSTLNHSNIAPKNEVNIINDNQINNNFFRGNGDSEFSFFNNSKINSEDEIFINEKQNIHQNKTNLNENEITNTITVNKGRVIKTKNETTSNILKELFDSDEIDFDTKIDMQLIKSKKRRRTKKEILDDKALSKENEVSKKRKKGRIKKNETKELDCQIHSKINDDNIIKKIHSFYPENIRNWLNSSFLDEKGNFLPPSEKFLKLQNSKIFSNLKKKKIIELLPTRFKDIFSKNLSQKYKNKDKNHNKDLIEEIYKENNQYFIQFILELTYLEGLNIFSGEITLENFIKLLKEKNINDKKSREFYDKFNKIDIFLKKIYSKEVKKETKEGVKEYIQRISILCINYKTWFERKFNRNSKKKEN